MISDCPQHFCLELAAVHFYWSISVVTDPSRMYLLLEVTGLVLSILPPSSLTEHSKSSTTVFLINWNCLTDVSPKPSYFIYGGIFVVNDFNLFTLVQLCNSWPDFPHPHAWKQWAWTQPTPVLHPFLSVQYCPLKFYSRFPKDAEGGSCQMLGPLHNL